jgi:large subunit ribosomal protein L14e
MIKSVKVGQLVKSRSGRDKDRYFLVYQVMEEKSYVCLVDGEKRSIKNPKLKNMRHIQVTNKVAEEFAEKIQKEIIPSDLETRRYLWELVN